MTKNFTDPDVVLKALARAAKLAKDGPQDIRAGKFVLHERRAPLPESLKAKAIQRTDTPKQS